MAMTLSAVRDDFQPCIALDGYRSEGREPASLNAHLRTLQGQSQRLHFSRNEMIFSEGDAATKVYKISSGTVRLCRHTPDGRRHIIEFLLPGDLIGFVETPTQPATAEAVTDVTLISYPRSSFDRLAASNPAIRADVLCHLSANLLDAQERLFILGCQSAKERVASFLLRLADRTDVLDGDRLDLPMGRQDVADHLGLTIETVCRAISALKADGLVAVPNTHQLILRSLPALRALATEI